MLFIQWKMEWTVDRKIEPGCEKEDFLDYRNILVLIFVINEVFHRIFQQDHRLFVQELLKEKDSKIL